MKLELHVVNCPQTDLQEKKKKKRKKKTEKVNRPAKVMRVQCAYIFIAVLFSHDIAFQSSFAEVWIYLWTNINKWTLNWYFGEFYWNFDTFILTSHSGCINRLIRVSFTSSWSSPHKYLINCHAHANFKSQICDWERLRAFSQQLPQEPRIPENSSRAPLNEFLQF